MNIYLLSRTESVGYDEFDSCVVCAGSIDLAKDIHPDGRRLSKMEGNLYGSWANAPKLITAKKIGIAGDDQEEGVILASFNAG